MKFVWGLIAALLIPTWATAAGSESDVGTSYGKFVGEVVAKWGPDGRTMELMQPFTYIDGAGAHWNAPAGSVVDGASIPRAAWSFIGGPYEGKYRKASVIHDVACDEKARPWQDVHRAFYHAMLLEGNDPFTAKVMYGAVYLGGPRWEQKKVIAKVPYAKLDSTLREIYADARSRQESVRTEVLRMPGSNANVPDGQVGIGGPQEQDDRTLIVSFISTPVEIDEQEFKRLQAFVKNNNPSLEEIENFQP